MFINLQKHFIFILFELVIFLILAIQLYQLLTEYVLPPLRKKIAELHQYWIDLQNKLTLTTQTKKRLQTKVKDQKVSLSNLEKKNPVLACFIDGKTKNL